MRGPVVGKGAFASQCAYASVSTGADTVTFEFGPFPDVGGPASTLQQAKQQVVGLYKMGTPKDRANERIVDTPALGRGSFVDAALISGVRPGTVEDVTAYTSSWLITVSMSADRLLGGHELAWVTNVVAALPR